MKIQVRGNHLEVTDALRQYVEKKIGRLEKYFNAPNVHTVTVTLSVLREMHAVEVTMPIDGYVIRAEDKSSDMYASIDMVSEKVEKQIDKHKSKLNKRLRQEGIHSLFKEVEATPVGAPVAVDEEDGEIVRVKKFAIKPMPVDEAMMQMELLGHDFYVFSNAETEEVNVIYKRHDGQYGLIEPTFS